MDYDFLFDKVRRQLVIGYNVAQLRIDEGATICWHRKRDCAISSPSRRESCHRKAGLRRAPADLAEPGPAGMERVDVEYLMPLLVMPTYENTCSIRPMSPRWSDRSNMEGNGVPWGMSESGYNTVDVHLNYQYRAFGVPGLGLKRGLAEDLVVRRSVGARPDGRPEAACLNLQRRPPEAWPEYSVCSRRSITPRRGSAAAKRAPWSGRSWRITRA
jgi:hypothetical protein